MSKEISVVVGDSQMLCRLGLSQVLRKNEDVDIVGEVENQQELLRKVVHHKPDVVIVDYNQPTFFDENVVAEIKNISPNSKILVISSDDRKERIYSVLENGVNSYLTKQCDPQEILDAIHATSKNEKFYCHKILDLLIEKSFPSKDQNCSLTALSPREKEILTMVAQGKTAKEIAFDLNLSHHTVYTHRKNILKKLNLTSPTEMIVYAIENGLTSIK